MRLLKTSFSRLLALFRPPPRRQVAALCWRSAGDAAEILLVTTRGTGRWTPPRGWPMDGKSLAEAAATEAWEEAGAIGEVQADPIGVYSYDKFTSRGGAGQPLEVTVFALKVDRLIDDYREAGQRKRKWMSGGEAAIAVREPDLSRIFREFRRPQEIAVGDQNG